MHLERAYCVWSILWLYSAASPGPSLLAQKSIKSPFEPARDFSTVTKGQTRPSKYVDSQYSLLYSHRNVKTTFEPAHEVLVQ